MHDSVRGVSLRTLLPKATFFGTDGDIVIHSCSADSRTVQAGDLFAALVGAECDGHDFVHEAAFRGAKAVLAERYVVADGLPVCVVPDTRAAFAQICQALAGSASRQIKVIGITGTNGKSAAVSLVANVLHSAGSSVAWMSSLGTFDGVEYVPSASATPTAPSIASWLANAEANGCDFAVLEASSQALSQSRLAGIQLDCACITNVRRDHLDEHSTLKNYREVKSRLLKLLKPEGVAVLNLDDPTCAEFGRNLDGPALTTGMLTNSDVTAVLLERSISEQTFLLTAGSETVPVRTRTIGDGMIYNCLTAAAVGLLYGVSPTEIARGLERLDYVPGRMERVECGQSFTVFVDAAKSPETLSNCLESLREVVSGRLICVFGAKGDTCREQRSHLGQTAEALSDLAVITDDNPTNEDPATIVSDILSGFDSLGQAVVIHDRAQAICWALAHAHAGDCIVITGKGHEEHQLIGKHRTWFDDREIARQWLYEQAAQTRLPHENWRELRAG
ncbi:MAG: UDP-N-acetylmuramoyl-L-alanyl-D-glutamate--2,6-diaminopimelate ligase [Planctomycetota bacterium]|nr:UDP-N-acetylmuramoyl-L-alanyl-D-glutamate--2,6-diaminopimelate ligase [Planctomycetota bacterium]